MVLDEGTRKVAWFPNKLPTQQGSSPRKEGTILLYYTLKDEVECYRCSIDEIKTFSKWTILDCRERSWLMNGWIISAIHSGSNNEINTLISFLWALNLCFHYGHFKDFYINSSGLSNTCDEIVPTIALLTSLNF